MKLLLQMEGKHNENVVNDESIVCVVARAGSLEPIVVADTIKKLMSRNFGPPLHTLVIPGKLHFMEIEALVKLATLPIELSEKLQKL